MTDAQIGRAISHLDPLEQKIGFAAGAIATLLALATTLPYVLHPNHTVRQTVAATKTHGCSNRAFTYDKSAKDCVGNVLYSRDHWELLLLLMLAFAAGLLVAVRVRRRAATGFLALFTGFAYETLLSVFGLEILGIPFIAVGGWLLIRAWRVQRYGSPTATKANPTGESKVPAPRTERQRRSTKVATPERKPPAASKRYTPKAPRKKRPQPTTPPPS